MSESPTQQEHVEAIVEVVNPVFDPQELRLVERRRSDGDSKYRVVRLRKSRSLTELEMRYQFEPYTPYRRRDVSHEPSTSLEREIRKADTETSVKEEPCSSSAKKKTKKVNTAITISGIVLIFIMLVVCYFYIRNDIEAGLIGNPQMSPPKPST